MDELRVSKYHGTGNDFVMVEDLDGLLDLSPALIAALCDRHLGIGADGLIRVTGANDADFFMDYSNADGSVAEMCGNGIRCLAKLVYERGFTDKTDLAVVTRDGVKHVSLTVRAGVVEAVRVDMGMPRFTRREIPMEPLDDETFLAEPFEGAGLSVKASAVSMGNPHLVLFVDHDPDEMDVRTIGPALEHDPRFPNKTNVEFVVAAGDGLKLRVWERGVGETMACGSGACAAAVASHLAGLVPRQTKVHYPGGTLDLEWAEDDHVLLSGPAEKVYDATLDRAWLEAAQRRGRDG